MFSILLTRCQNIIIVKKIDSPTFNLDSVLNEKLVNTVCLVVGTAGIRYSSIFQSAWSFLRHIGIFHRAEARCMVQVGETVRALLGFYGPKSSDNTIENKTGSDSKDDKFI